MNIHLIKCVRKNANKKLVAFKTENGTVLTEKELIEHIEAGGLAYVSGTKTKIIVEVKDGEKFVKTEGNNTTVDNLDNLPLF